MSVRASVDLLKCKFGGDHLEFSDRGSSNNPDIAIYLEKEHSGQAEVKTIVDQELTEMLSVLFKGKFFREDRLGKPGQFHLTLEKQARIKLVKREFWKLFVHLSGDPHQQALVVQRALSYLGVQGVKYMESTENFSLVLHPPTITFGPSEGQITGKDLLE